jgi:hypothetical protein
MMAAMLRPIAAAVVMTKMEIHIATSAKFQPENARLWALFHLKCVIAAT